MTGFKINPHRMTAQQIADVVAVRYGLDAQKYLKGLVRRAGMANYGRKYAAALELLKPEPKSSPYTSVQGADEIPEADFYGEADFHGEG